MNKLIEAIRSIKIKSILGVFLGGLLIFVTTACGAANANPPAPRLSGEGSINSTKGPQSELYAPVQSKKPGGMYPYNDENVTSPRAEAKAKALVKNSEENINKVNSPKDFVENYRKGTPLGERTENLLEDVGDSAKEIADDWKGGTQKGLRNVKNNSERAVDMAKDTTDEATSPIKRGVEKGAKQLQNKAEDAGRAIDRAM